VNNILDDLGALNKPVILILNKIDLVDEKKQTAVFSQREKVFEVSAVNGTGLELLLRL
jgi:GTP-binding protein HflX